MIDKFVLIVLCFLSGLDETLCCHCECNSQKQEIFIPHLYYCVPIPYSNPIIKHPLYEPPKYTNIDNNAKESSTEKKLLPLLPFPKMESEIKKGEIKNVKQPEKPPNSFEKPVKENFMEDLEKLKFPSLPKKEEEPIKSKEKAEEKKHTTSPIINEQKSNDNDKKDDSVKEDYDHHHHHHHDKNAHYKFEYAVNDKKTKDVKFHKEELNGDKVEGEYSLLEDDGNIRTVKYTADWKNGFRAQVHNSKKKSTFN